MRPRSTLRGRPPSARGRPLSAATGGDDDGPGIARAETKFEDALASADEFNLGAREFIVLCVQLLWDEEYAGTAAAARMGLSVHPESTTLESLLAEALLRSGEVAEARSILDGILQDDPHHATALELLRHASR